MIRRQTVKNTLLAIAVTLLMAFAVAAIPQAAHAEDSGDHTWNVKSIEFTPASAAINMSEIMREDNDGIYALDLKYRYKRPFDNTCFFMPGDKCIVTYNDSSTKEFEFSKIRGVQYAEFMADDGEIINLEALHTDNALELKSSAEVSVDELAAIIGENGVTIEYGDYWEEGGEILGNKVRTHTSLDVIEDTTHDHKTALRERNKADALCDATGMSRDCQYCQVCGKYFADHDATVELNKADLIIPMLGHRWEGAHSVILEPTCTENGYESIYCANGCGEKTEREIPAKGHVWNKNYTVDKKATYAAAGSKSIHCSVCNARKPKSDVSVPKLIVKAVKLKSVKAGKKGFTARWTKGTGINGYEIQYARNKKFTKSKKTVFVKKPGTVSRKVTKLKAKKKYYVRVRAYKTVSGKKYRSKWSNIKAVTTKR